MPRVALSQEQKRRYKVIDLAAWIDGRMHMLGLRQEDIAKELGITQAAFSARLNPKTYKNKKADPFKYGDLLIIFKILGVTQEELKKLMLLQ